MFCVVHKRIFKRVCVTGAALSAVAAIIGAALPSQAATSPGWRQFAHGHYGPAAAFSSFNEVLALSKTNAWALGGNMAGNGNPATGLPVALHWNGKAWASTALPKNVTDTIVRASAPAANDIWAVTRSGGWILHWNGSAWSVAKHLTTTGGFSGITAFSPTNVWVFGGGGGASPGFVGTWHYDGHTWTELKTGQAAGLEFASPISANDIFAIGGTAIERFNGKTWFLASTKGIPAGQWTFSGIRAVSDKNVWVTASRLVNNSDVPSLLHYNGSAWTTYPLPWSVTSGQSSGIASPVLDGQGGLCFTGETETLPPNSGAAFYVVRRTATGQWLRTKLGSQASAGNSGVFLLGLALIPGTASVWGVGNQVGGKNAVIWAYGKVGA
jgi:hypothetical protein